MKPDIFVFSLRSGVILDICTWSHKTHLLLAHYYAQAVLIRVYAACTRRDCVAYPGNGFFLVFNELTRSLKPCDDVTPNQSLIGASRTGPSGEMRSICEASENKSVEKREEVKWERRR